MTTSRIGKRWSGLKVERLKHDANAPERISEKGLSSASGETSVRVPEGEQAECSLCFGEGGAYGPCRECKG